MTDLEIIRHPWQLKKEIKRSPSRAGEFSLLKWSKENRGYLFGDFDRVETLCGLCILYYSEDCNNCPLKIEDDQCFENKHYTNTLYAIIKKDEKEFNKHADLFETFIKERLKGTK